VLSRLGEYELRRITPAVIAGFADELRRDGVGDPTVRKVLSPGRISLCRFASPSRGRRRAVRPLPPATVEQLRRLMPTDQDVALVSVLAYAGLRPGEALALTWADVGERTILVERSVALGEVKETKTRTTRFVRLLAPLSKDLKALRMQSGRPGDEELIFPRPDGEPWAATRAILRRWRSTPTDTSSTSSNAEPASAEQLIRDARATLVRPSYQNVGSQANENST